MEDEAILPVVPRTQTMGSQPMTSTAGSTMGNAPMANTQGMIGGMVQSANTQGMGNSIAGVEAAMGSVPSAARIPQQNVPSAARIPQQTVTSAARIPQQNVPSARNVRGADRARQEPMSSQEFTRQESIKLLKEGKTPFFEGATDFHPDIGHYRVAPGQDPNVVTQSLLKKKGLY